MLELDADIQLMQTFGFTKADILANRQGEMSPSQKKETLRNGIVVFAAFAGVGFLLAVLMFSGYSKKPAYTTSQVAMFFCLMVFIIFLLIGLAFFFGTWSATKSGALRCASGQVSFEPTLFKTTFFFEPDDKNLRLRIEGFRLYLKDPAVRHLFIPGVKYNVYFSPILRAVFSVETAKN